ncbi:MAG: uroporphyrinogen-III C-methyltransferase [Candidatus Hydrogenedentes bacterium]|nr:uroporphyrinogen-III C-methyltransferase [Candidatus Hydrogenedentota bacterium]
MDEQSRPSQPGLVWLVGAGPGDPGLITVRGMQCIAQADVIVHDALANPALLDSARPDCEIICAGKRAGRHSMPQDATNQCLVEKACEGKRVCRLKGGDPFVFGRGGEEAFYLEEHGIPFEIVPGVTSAVAVPAYAGIPVTHRGAAASFRVITGHESPDKDDSGLDWHDIAHTEGTLVFLMGVRNASIVCERLVAHGRSPETPAAIIANGTGATQQTVVATLADLAERARDGGIEAPAVIVVGEVVRLRERLAWFERRPLFGRRIVVTRARAQASVFAQTLAELGADVIQLPTIRIESLADTPDMREAARNAGLAHWCVFTSVNGVDAFVHALELEGLDVRALAGVRIAAIGPPTAERLRQSGLRAQLVPERYVAEGLLDAFGSLGSIEGQRFLLPRSAIARPALADGLRARGGIVHEVAAYRTHGGDDMPESLLELLEQGKVDLVSFTSSSTVDNFVAALPAPRRAAILQQVRGASIGPITSEAMGAAGIPIAVTASASTIPGLTEAIIEHFRNTSEAS